MKIHSLALLVALFFTSCSSNEGKKQQLEIDNKVKSTKVIDSSHVLVDDSDMDSDQDNEVQTLYIVIADTGKNYNELFKQLSILNQKFAIPIDLMERAYNEKKDLIALSGNSEDEIYAGEYFPRRFPSIALSLEYLSFYDEEIHPKTIALIVGIFETKDEAQNLLTKIQGNNKRSYIFTADVYQGCIH